MRINSFSLPLDRPLSTAQGSISERTGFVVRYDHRGQTGIGEATPLPGWTESLDECRTALDRAAQASREGHGAALLTLRASEVPAARHGFATALLDADARADGVPLYRWFDEDRDCRLVPVNATVGDASAAATADAVADAVSEGFDCCKIKVGAREVEADIERLAAVRDRVGSDVTLRADANGAWTEQEATEAFKAFDILDVEYVEQPLPAADLAGHARLRALDTDVGVALDESLAGRRVDSVLKADAADVLILKPMVLGGPGTTYTLAMRARELGVEPVVTTTIDGVVARLAALHVAAAIPDVRPCGLATGARLATDLGADPAAVVHGQLAVPHDSGLGIDQGEVHPRA